MPVLSTRTDIASLSPSEWFHGFLFSRRMRRSITSLSPAKTHRDMLSSDIGMDHKLDGII